MIKRRTLPAATASALAAPAIAQKPATLRFAPEGDVAVLDPIWTTAEATALRKLRDVRTGFPQFYDVRPT